MKLIYKIIAGCFFWLCFVLVGTMPVYGAEPVVVVLDPGHGGENLGAEYNGYTEKDMTMIVATAMKEELEKYEGVEVYLTRDVDKDMSLRNGQNLRLLKTQIFFFACILICLLAMSFSARRCGFRHLGRNIRKDTLLPVRKWNC